MFISTDCPVTNKTGSMSFTSIRLPLLLAGVFDVVLKEARNLRTNSRTETPNMTGPMMVNNAVILSSSALKSSPFCAERYRL